MNDDFEKGCKWTFGNPGENTQDEGPNNASSETFKEDPYSSLVRESIQNSLDAVADPNQAVRVSFEIGSIRPKAYPGFFELQQDIQECIESFKGKAEQAYGNALSLLESFRNNPNKSLYFIKISDSNTTGMEYKEGDTSSRFYSFVRSIGVSNKDNTSAGGSFGFGKAAYFNISPIRSILVSTLTWKGQYVFEGIASPEAVAVSMVDMGTHFRLICAKIKLIKQPEPMPKLPVARLMWELIPDFRTGAAAWIYAGGAHHAVVSTALTVQDIKMFAKFTETELIVIDENTRVD